VSDHQAPRPDFADSSDPAFAGLRPSVRTTEDRASVHRERDHAHSPDTLQVERNAPYGSYSGRRGGPFARTNCGSQPDGDKVISVAPCALDHTSSGEQTGAAFNKVELRVRQQRMTETVMCRRRRPRRDDARAPAGQGRGAGHRPGEARGLPARLPRRHGARLHIEAARRTRARTGVRRDPAPARRHDHHGDGRRLGDHRAESDPRRAQAHRARPTVGLPRAAGHRRRAWARRRPAPTNATAE
jgi:hypothetical protein